MATNTQELLNKYPEEFKKIGAIFYSLSRIEITLITVLSMLFMDRANPQGEKNFILNDAFADENIFPSFENKLCLLEKSIKYLARLAQEKNREFDEKKWLELCNCIRKVQQVRNKLAHHHLLFPGNKAGEVGYQVRKSPKERLADQKAKIPGSVKIIRINLDSELEYADKIATRSDELITIFEGEAEKLQVRGLVP